MSGTSTTAQALKKAHKLVTSAIEALTHAGIRPEAYSLYDCAAYLNTGYQDAVEAARGPRFYASRTVGGPTPWCVIDRDARADVAYFYTKERAESYAASANNNN